MCNVQEYPSTLIRDNNNIKDIIMGTKYFGIYHNNNSVYDKKINFVGKFTEISMGIDTIVISNRGKDEFIPNFNRNTLMDISPKITFQIRIHARKWIAHIRLIFGKSNKFVPNIHK